MLVSEIGYNASAEKLGIKACTLRQWAKRFSWNVTRRHAQQTVTAVTTPANALDRTLTQLGESTRTALAKAHHKAAAHAATLPAKDLMSKNTAIALRLHGQGAGLVHAWEAKQQQTNVMVNIALLGVDPGEVNASARVVEDGE